MEDEEDETIPIHNNYHNHNQPVVHNPLPFNPYVIDNDATVKHN